MPTVTLPAVSCPTLGNDDAAAFLGLQPQTLALWRCTNRHPELAYIKVGRRIRYRISDLEAFLAANTIGGSEQ